MQSYKVSVWSENNWYVAQCLDIDVASQGESEEEALENLKEALLLHLAPPVSTVQPKIISITIDAA